MRDHILLVQALQHKATRENAEWYATFLDFAKAYDRVDQKFQFDVMAKMNIGLDFLRWVQLLYTKPEVQLLINARLSALVPLVRFYIEPLGAMLRTAPELGNPMDDGSSLTGVFFADDSTVLSNSLESADHQVTTIVGTFCAASGAALNMSKCTTLALNNNEVPKGRPSAPSIVLAASGEPIKFLGIYVGHNLAADYQAQLTNDNYLGAYAKWMC
ncbi:Aste57867_14546 [Aphanomyces stellatus]|uniref:Aste57867_14546 protein n=1 Tax=Aphanomyces stellatus TaxID=120398 RepID=A0A485L0Y2_9STRA|nr:hypothetical protein As57867_014492 [Aphanomyces stellatus]VFT91368.1 Aste57867_14546 [Aphanomyces stellatus]